MDPLSPSQDRNTQQGVFISSIAEIIIPLFDMSTQEGQTAYWEAIKRAKPFLDQAFDALTEK